MEAASYILIAVGGLTALAGFIVVLMVAFRVGVGWGLAVLFLSWLVIPLVVFLVKYWPEARAGFLLSISGWLVSAVGSFLLAGTVASSPLADFGEYNPPPQRQEEPAPPPIEDELEVPAVQPPPQQVTPTVTPSPLPAPTPTAPATVAAAPEAASPTPQVIPLAEATDHVGEMVLLAMADGTRRRVVIAAVDADGLQVTEQVGGGAMTYPLRWDAIEGIRRLD